MIRGSVVTSSEETLTPAVDQKCTSVTRFTLSPLVLLYTTNAPLMNSTKCRGPTAPLGSGGNPISFTLYVLPVKFWPILACTPALAPTLFSTRPTHSTHLQAL